MRSKVGPLKVEGDDGPEIVVEPKRQAKILNEFYSSVFSRSQGAVATKERPVDVPVIKEVCIDVESEEHNRTSKRKLSSGTRRYTKQTDH